MNQNLCYHCFQMKANAGACPHCGFDPAQDAGKYPLALPYETVLGGRYILGRVLGQGGFGITYVAMDYQTKARVAVKEYFPDTMATRTNHTVTAFTGQRSESFLYGMRCFLEEAETLAQFIGNPNIIRIYSYFEENGTAYFVMEYVEGKSLQQYVQERGGRIPWAEAKQLLLPAMYALAAVHARGIIHRDVTPDNFFLTADGTVKLLDFGAARYSLGDKSRSLDVVLKHGFAPKEQYTRHGRQGPYTDIYSFAATMYAVTSGRLPPDSIDRMDEDDLVPPNRLGVVISSQEEEVLLKALSVQPADRYQTMPELIQALQQAEQGIQRSVNAPRPGMQNHIEYRQPSGQVTQPAPAPQPRQVTQPAPAPQPRQVTQPAPAPQPRQVVQPAPAPQPRQVVQPAPAPQPRQVIQPAPAPQPGQVVQPRPSPQPKKNGAWKIVIPVAAVLAAVTVGGVLAFRKISYDMRMKNAQNGKIDLTSQTDTPVPDTQLPYESVMQDTENHIYVENESRIAPARTVKVSLEVGSVEYDPATGKIIERVASEYTDDGLKMRVMHYQGDDTVTGWTEYSYDANGNPSREVTYNADDSVKSSRVYYNDENDPDVTYLLLYEGSDKLQEGYAIKLDDQGRIVRRSNLDGNMQVISSLEHVYDTHGNDIRTTWYDADNKVTSYTEYRYSYGGSRITMDEIAYDGNGKGIKTDDHVYDADQHELEWVWYNDDGTVNAWQKYEYDSSGTLIRTDYLNPDGSSAGYTMYTHDGYGNLTDEVLHLPDGSIEHGMMCTYEYDTDGNMLKQTVSQGAADKVQYIREYTVFTVPETSLIENSLQ